MRTLKLFTMTMLLLASLGLAACTNTDVSGTAGDTPPEVPGKEVPPDPQNPPEKPGGNVDPGSGNTDPGQEKGGANDPGSGGNADASKEITLESFLAQLNPSQRLDFAYIEEHCGAPCLEASEALNAFIQELCATSPDDCTAELQAMLTKQRTTTQVRNDQGLVGLPNADTVSKLLQQSQGGAPAGGGDTSGGDAGTGGGDTGGQAGGGDTGGDTGGQAGGGDNKGGDEGKALPAAPVAAAAAVQAVIESIGLDTLSWNEIAGAADKADVAALATYFQQITEGGLALPGCDDCVDTMNDLMGGNNVDVDDIRNLLIAIQTIG